MIKNFDLCARSVQQCVYADMCILDLDDGVKVNYGKFGDLLDVVMAVTGEKDEE